jgi:hypothetical protein
MTEGKPQVLEVYFGGIYGKGLYFNNFDAGGGGCLRNIQ